MDVPAPIPASAVPPPSDAAVELCRALEALELKVSLADADRVGYARDMWPKAMLWIRRGRIPPPPDAVVWPESEEQLVEIVRQCRARKVALIPYGAGSGVCGGTWALKGGIAVDLKRFDRVGRVDADRRAVEAQAGVIGEVLERDLFAQGWTLGHFPSSIYMSTLGGWLSARSAGQLSSRYGKIEDMVLELRAVTGAGALVVTPERPFAGPDLAQLFVGAEGTFGFVTGARLRVTPAPEAKVFRGVRFRTVADGLEAIRQIFRAGLRPAVVRLYDPFDTAIVGKHGGRRERLPPSLRGLWKGEVWPLLARQLLPRTLSRPALFNRAADLLRQCLLILMFEGEAKRARSEDELALAICERHRGVDQGESPGRTWYQHRYDVSYKMSGVLDAGAFADTMEVATTWDKVLDVYERVRAAVSPLAFVMCHFSHAYLEGCSLYFSFAASDVSEDAMERRYDELWRAALGAATSAGANVSHHHGIGALKAQKLVDEMGNARRLLFALGRGLDPDGIMNPGKLVPLSVWERERSAVRQSAAPKAFNEGTRQALMDYLGERYAERGGRVVATPANERELAGVLRILRERGGQLHRDVVLSRARFDGIGPIDEKSATARVGAGVRMDALDLQLASKGLGLGPLSPRAMALELAAFLEGPYAGLRAVRGGRLEPLALSVSAMLADGLTFTTHESPRRAAGPDLDALFFGGDGRFGLVLGATLRCHVRPRASRSATYSFASAPSLLAALHGALSDGCWLEKAVVQKKGERYLLEAALLGEPDAVETDLASMSHHVFARGGRSSGQTVASPQVTAEREAGWAEVLGALESGAPLALYRAALSSVVVVGAELGRRLDEPSGWPLEPTWRALLSEADPEAVLGGAP